MTQQDTASGSRRLTMQYAGGLVKHLGLSMYRGAVPALAELIANAWDADATVVQLTIPFETGIQDQVIVVEDNGRGMSWDDVDSAYLLVGRDKRKAEGEKSPGGRLLMGRKGLGKLAGFGIASVVEVRTVRDGWLTHFSMNFQEMTRGGAAKLVEDYSPKVLADEACGEGNGTCVTLRELQIMRAIPKVQFRDSMARRFSILQKGFNVVLNGESLAPYNVPLQFEFKGAHDGWEDVRGVGQVRWRMGFTEKPIQAEPARGIAVLVRNRMAQAPFFFDLSGGAYGQAGMQYMTGEVQVDQLDAVADYVGTDRQGILWAEPMPAALLEWGEGKVRGLLRTWSAERAKANERNLIRTLSPGDDSVEKRLSRLQPSEQKEARKIIQKLASIESVTDEPERARDLLDLLLRAFEDSAFFALLRALGETSQAERGELLRLVTELDVFETVKMAEVVRARVGVIRKFQEMLEADVPEKPDMQEFLFRHPWLIDPEWQVVEHERGLERLLIDRFGLDPQEANPESKRRVDFFCVGTRGRHLVVEVKRPRKPIGRSEVLQLLDYLIYLRTQSPGKPGSPNSYEGILVGHHVTSEGVVWRDSQAGNGITVRSWKELFDVAERIHREFLDVIKSRSPEDSRVQSIQQISEGVSEHD